MIKIKSILSKIFNIIFSTRAAGVYMLLFAFSIGLATFVENDYGTSTAQNMIFKSRWFELLLVLFAGTILTNIFRFRMVQQKKWASVTFHSSIIIILLGAGLTRYFGYEGMMHIREGGSSNYFLSTEDFLSFKVVENGKTYSFAEPTAFSTKSSRDFNQEFQINNNVYGVKLNKFIPNPAEKIIESQNGSPILKIVIGSQDGRQEFFIKYGDRAQINGTNFNFTNEDLPNAFNIKVESDSLLFKSDIAVIQTVMATQKTDTIYPNSNFQNLRLRSLYVHGNSSFVFGDYKPKGDISIEPGNLKMKSESIAGVSLLISKNGETKEVVVTGRKGEEGRPKELVFGDVNFLVSYGAKRIGLPFSLELKDFIMERYPGTNSPSSYASEVILIDPAEGVNRPFRIYMNNILDYGGYRFFQSSYDPDEAGTYLSVNNDFWGTWVSYLGYFLLTLGLLMTFFIKNSRFSQLIKKLDQNQQKTLGAIIFLIFTTIGFGQTSIPGADISADAAREFGHLMVQDHRGRIKPINTLSSEILRKIAKNDELFNYSSDQIFVSMMVDPPKWENVPLINIGTHPEIQRLLGTSEKMVTYRQFFNNDGEYILREQIRNAQSTNPKDQGTLEKAIIKLDEKVNIANMIFSGRLLKIFPIPDDPANTWTSPGELNESRGANLTSSNINEMNENLIEALQSGKASGNFGPLLAQIETISNNQKQIGINVIPSSGKISAEILLNKLNVFGKLRNVYGILSVLFLVLFFASVFKFDRDFTKITKIAWFSLVAIFAFHTLGLGLRWYVSGRAPWSNGYESMIYISWTTMLAGLIFSRRSLGGMSATLVLAATILLVAGMSWLDPEITPLVPVLKSYWLTIHVSLEAGSYGFLMLGAVIGMLNLSLIALSNKQNLPTIHRTVKELTIISEITLLGGLFMVSVGTYLGGVWANESWGRYWGWDAKETWALVTILVYAFILHMRFIPGLQSIFAFNFASLFGFATVIMTYFGVNYYLSGLHSYAAGDPVPIPSQVYYTSICLLILSLAAFIKYRKLYRKA